jgi:L-2,4-diaminobutyrate decarboxylase
MGARTKTDSALPERDGESHPIATHAADPARERIGTAFDPELLGAAGAQLIDRITDHMRRVQSREGPVLNWREPGDLVSAARTSLRQSESLDASQEADPAELVRRFDSLVQQALAGGNNLHHPHYVGHQVAASVPLAGLFDALGAVTNQVMAIYEMGPWATAVEQALVEELGQAIGWEPGQFAGLVTHGGSLANLTALLTARNVALGDAWTHGTAGEGPAPVVIVHGDAHYSIARAVGILGIGTDNLLRAPLDAQRRMDPARLEEMLSRLKEEGRPVIAVAAAACATPIGAFDPLPEIAKVCREHGVWLHVDAAHGGAACLSHKYRHLVAGLDQADSVVWDAHKMMFMPALCAFVFYRDREHRFTAFQQDAPYLFDPSAPGIAEYDSALKTIECTKRAAALGLWGVWSMFGPQLFGDMVDVTFDLGETLYQKLKAAPDFEPLHRPQCNIVAFRYVPEVMRMAPAEELGRFQLELRREIIESGQFYLVQTEADGVGALRVTLINPLTTAADLDGLMEALRDQGRALLES